MCDLDFNKVFFLFILCMMPVGIYFNYQMFKAKLNLMNSGAAFLHRVVK